MFPKDIEPFIWWLLSYPSPALFYITPHFRPYEPHLCILAFKRKMRYQEWEFTCDFRERRGFCPSFQYFSSNWSLWVRKNFSKYENLKFSLISLIEGIIWSNFKLFLSLNPMRQTFSSRIVKTYFQPNLMKYISKSNDTCFFMIQNENPIVWSHVQIF